MGAGCREFESLYPDQILNVVSVAPVAQPDRATAFELRFIFVENGSQIEAEPGAFDGNATVGVEGTVSVEP